MGYRAQTVVGDSSGSGRVQPPPRIDGVWCQRLQSGRWSWRRFRAPSLGALHGALVLMHMGAGAGTVAAVAWPCQHCACIHMACLLCGEGERRHMLPLRGAKPPRRTGATRFWRRKMRGRHRLDADDAGRMCGGGCSGIAVGARGAAGAGRRRAACGAAGCQWQAGRICVRPTSAGGHPPNGWQRTPRWAARSRF